MWCSLGAACAQPLLPLPEKPASASSKKTPGVPEVPERMCCSTCGQVFGSREEQVSGAGWPAGGGSVAARVLLQRLSPSAPAPQSSAAQVLLESVTQTLHIIAYSVLYWREVVHAALYLFRLTVTWLTP